MRYRLLHSGFDQFDIAFQGAPSLDVLEQLKEAKEKAKEQEGPTLVAVGPGNVQMHVANHGMRGGYAFVCDTGPVGEKWFLKDDPNQSEWNIFASVHSRSLICKSLTQVMGGLRETLDQMGCRIGRESVNRVDYAMDFLAADFELQPELFVCHPRTKSSVRWSKKREDEDQPSAVLSGRRCKSVTIGKMPGRQIIAYDKRSDSLDKGKLFWFRVWGLNPEDAALQVWRIELRAGKRHLKDVWNLQTFDQVFACIGEVYGKSLKEIRYLLPDQADSNVSRQGVHPIWEAATTTAGAAFAHHKVRLSADEVREIDRQQYVGTYVQQIMGNAAGLAAALGLDDSSLDEHLPSHITHELKKRLKYCDASFWRSLERARDRLHFQSP